MLKFTGRVTNITLSTVALLVVTGVAIADTNPPPFVASPDIFKVISENAQYRIIEATLEPGQRSQTYAAPMRGVYFLTDCALRRLQPNVNPRETFSAAASAIVMPEVSSQSTENAGKSVCKMVTFESK